VLPVAVEFCLCFSRHFGRFVHFLNSIFLSLSPSTCIVCRCLQRRVTCWTRLGRGPTWANQLYWRRLVVPGQELAAVWRWRVYSGMIRVSQTVMTVKWIECTQRSLDATAAGWCSLNAALRRAQSDITELNWHGSVFHAPGASLRGLEKSTDSQNLRF